jgi:copper(I)-binding protein
MKTHVAAALAALLFYTPVLADGHGHKGHSSGAMHNQEIMIKAPWARASIGKNGAAFLTVVNMGKTDDKLVGASSDIAKRVELHTHKMDGNIMRMRQVENIPIPAGGTITLKPGGHHVMFMGLGRKLTEGEEFPLTLIFEKAGRMQVNVKIGKMGAMGAGGKMPDHGSHGGQKMKH